MAHFDASPSQAELAFVEEVATSQNKVPSRRLMHLEDVARSTRDLDANTVCMDSSGIDCVVSQADINVSTHRTRSCQNDLAMCALFSYGLHMLATSGYVHQQRAMSAVVGEFRRIRQVRVPAASYPLPNHSAAGRT